MRFLILADIHANWYALETVLSDAKGEYDSVICCGDLVGYNPHPDRVAQWVRQQCRQVVRGNHDKLVCGLEKLSWFNEVAQCAALWTIRTMSEDNLYYLKSLPTGPCRMDGFEICHGSPRDEDEYITNPGEAKDCFSALAGNLIFFGHSHLQGGFLERRTKISRIAAVRKKDRESIFQLELDALYMINAGSVGQPRDGDPRAAYALYESEERVVTLRRVEYPIERTVADIEEAGLPDVLGKRLTHGF